MANPMLTNMDTTDQININDNYILPSRTDSFRKDLRIARKDSGSSKNVYDQIEGIRVYKKKPRKCEVTMTNNKGVIDMYV